VSFFHGGVSFFHGGVSFFHGGAKNRRKLVDFSFFFSDLLQRSAINAATRREKCSIAATPRT